MKLLNRHKLIAYLVLIAYFPIISGMNYGFVLCVGNDGHIAVEYSGDGESCIQSETPRNSTSKQNHCGDCTDFPLLTEVTALKDQICSDVPPSQKLLPKHEKIIHYLSKPSPDNSITTFSLTTTRTAFQTADLYNVILLI